MRALTTYETTNMYGGAHNTNIDTAIKAAQQGRDLIVHASRYDGQCYKHYTYRVTNLRISDDGNVYGTDEGGEPWAATTTICDYALTGAL